MMGRQPFAIRPLDDEGARQRITEITSDKLCFGVYITPGPESGSGSSDDDWVRNLDFYAKLNERFENIDELYRQRQAFENYCNNRRPLGYLRRRKQTELEDKKSEEGLKEDSVEESSVEEGRVRKRRKM